MNRNFLEVYNLTKQIPKGKISTYKEIAKSLGNKNLVRIVGYILSKNTDRVNIPCHRVIRSNGEIGGYTSKNGISEKIEILRSEGIKIIDKKIVDLDVYLFKQFKLS
jgi:O-6-methylguanine DNA methyltransferase|tara:strand:- start:1666 stop:1986 length:321 start_codon:yes stop_codon:yes gene_type:complete